MIKIGSMKYLFVLQETYPSSPPVWFADVEEPIITNAIQLLSNTTGIDNHVINQVSFSSSFFCLILETGHCHRDFVL